MTVTTARRRLKQHGKNGNWRLKGLLLAALPESGVTAEEVAQAWPGRNKSEYSFLAENEDRTLEAEMKRTAVAHPGTERHRTLKDYAVNADSVPKRLSATSNGIKEDGDVIEARLDDAIPRMLFASATSEEVDTLFREQLMETVMAGAERRKIAREAATVQNVQTRSGKVPVGADETYAPATSEGAEIRDDNKGYATINWDATKYAQGGRVTDEMRDHAMIDAIEDAIEWAGAAVENAMNRDWLTTLLEDANGNHDTAGSEQGYLALNEAVGVVDEEDFAPNTYVTHPQFRTALAADSNLAYANRAGTNEVLTEREDAQMFQNLGGLDMEAAASSQTYDPNGSETWGYGADGEKGAVVYDRNHVHLFIYSANGEGMEIKDYDDPVRDLQGFNARIWADTNYSQQRAAATIQY